MGELLCRGVVEFTCICLADRLSVQGHFEFDVEMGGPGIADIRQERPVPMWRRPAEWLQRIGRDDERADRGCGGLGLVLALAVALAVALNWLHWIGSASGCLGLVALDRWHLQLPWIGCGNLDSRNFGLRFYTTDCVQASLVR